MTEREMKPPSDRDLTEKGLPLAPQTGRILLIACGALAREILDLKEANGWSHLDLTCLPAKLHLYPEKITDEVRAAVKKHRGKYDDIFVVYADCGTGGLLEVECEQLGAQLVAVQGPGPGARGRPFARARQWTKAAPSLRKAHSGRTA